MRTPMVAAAMILLLVSAASAQVRLPAIFSDHMVLQSGVEIPVWGWGNPNARIGVELGTQALEVRTDAGGRWLAQFPPLKGGEKLSLSVRGPANTVTYRDIVAGDVWIACGQSNMAFGLKGALGGKEAAAEANYPDIRFFTVGRVVAAEPRQDCGGRWQVCTPETAGSFSAVGFFFGRKLYRDRGVPTGIINASWNGTTCETWTRKDVLAEDKDLKGLLVDWDAKVAAYDPALENERYAVATAVYTKKLKAWEEASAKARADGTQAPKKPQPPQMTASPLVGSNYPGNCYNGMIAPLVRFPVKGVIWYQGESNAEAASVYTRLLSAMITDWRKQWRQAEMPFLLVQLPWRSRPEDGKAQDPWAPMREAQSRVLAMPATGMAVMVDSTEGILHPRDKQPVGERLALVARGVAYGEKVTYRGPVYSKLTVHDDLASIAFTHTDGGLVSKGGSVTGFSIAGEDGVFVPAEAKISGESVEIRSDKVKKLRGIRYGWSGLQTCSLYNGAGLPAEPFSADGWLNLTDPPR